MASIAIDLHGGDFGPSILIPSCVNFFFRNPHLHGIFVGDKSLYKHYSGTYPSNIEWVDALPIGDLAKKPSRLLRQDGHSSIEIAYKLLKDKKVNSLVSSEHTGVLSVLMSKYGQLHPLLNRAVLASWLPTQTKPTVMLDLGASFEATPDQLLAYAAIGVGLVEDMNSKPLVSLLNVGIEHFKGPQALKIAHDFLSTWDAIQFEGFIEASNLYRELADVIVCDGFTGNSVIKSSEGTFELVFELMNKHFDRSLFSKFMGYWLKKEFKASVAKLDPRLSNGAILAGSDLLIVKSHGKAKGDAFEAALNRAVMGMKSNYVERIWNQLDNLADFK